jgi:hypothetical protein
MQQYITIGKQKVRNNMRKVTLYKYIEKDNSITVTPLRRDKEDIPYKERLIADDGYILSNGINEIPCIDINFEDENKWDEMLYQCETKFEEV